MAAELTTLLRVQVTEVTGTTLFRYANYDTPFWSRNNTTDGRWHLANECAVQYLAFSPDAAWAELARREDLRTEEELALIRMPMWAIHVNQANIVDYRTFDKAEAAGFDPEALIAEDYSMCQAEGRRLRDAGYDGVIAPNAALPYHHNLTLFGPRIRASWGLPVRLASATPATVVALGCPSPGLTLSVRYRGEAHVGYENYVARGSTSSPTGTGWIVDDVDEDRTGTASADDFGEDDTT